MKHLLSFLFSLLLLGNIFVGCGDQQAPTSGTDNTAPVLMKPGSGGATVVKYQVEDYYWFTDDIAGLRIFVGFDVRELCNGVYQFDEFDFMDVYLPNTDPEEAERLVAKTRGHNVTVMVYPYPNNGCDYYLTNDPIAIGTANVRNTDNDILAFLGSHGNHNAFGWKVNGTLWSPDGQQRYRLNFVWRAVWDAEAFGTYKEHYKIMLIPVGGN
jgi:hypothetical protein